MDQVGQQFFTGARFAFDQDRGLGVSDAQCHLDGAAYHGRLTDDAVLAIAFVQRTTQVHDFRRQLIALECRADLVGNALDERDFVILKAFARLAPNQSEQTKRVPSDSHRRDERRATSEY